MFNAIPAINLLGASNPLLEQSNLAKIPQDIRTHNAERLSSRNVEEARQNAKARAAKRERSRDEDEAESEGDEPYPQQQHKPSIQERMEMARQGKVSLNQRAVSALFLNQAKSETRGAYNKEAKPERPSIDVVA